MSPSVVQTSDKRTAGLEESAFLSLQRTADALQVELATVLKPANLSPTQYNVLHILQEAGQYGMASRDIGERMITRDPDLTRLLDRLVARDFIARHRCDRDRRRVYSMITPVGRALLDQCDGPVSAKLREVLAHVGAEKLTTLIDLLGELRRHLRPGEVGCGGQATVEPPTCSGEAIGHPANDENES